MTTEIILGPPGTGKTTTLVDLVREELARGVPPDRICYVSFTKRAAQEAVERACEQFKLKREDFPYFSTLHSLCFRQLGLRRGDVLEGARLQEFAAHAGVRVSRGWSEDGTRVGFEEGDRVLFMENLARIRGLPLEEVYREDDDGLSWQLVRRVAADLAAYKRAKGLVDFTDMLQEFLRTGARPVLEVVIGDEVQDNSHLQWLVFEKLARGARRVAVAGDDDQAIYKWAGADVEHLIDLEGDARVLGQSWRVPPVVQRLANSVIRHAGRRREKNWKARAGGEGVIERAPRFTDVDCGSGQILVLARNVYVLREQVEPDLRRQGIIYQRNGARSVKEDLERAVRTWEQMRRGESADAASVREVLKWMSVGVGFRRGSKTLPGREDDELLTLRELRDSGAVLRDDAWFLALDRVPQDEVEYVRAILRRGDSLTSPRVTVSTIHGAKGGEADHVVLLKEMAARTWREMHRWPQDESRVWYVGATRAREKLTIVDGEGKLAQRCPWI